MARPESDSHDRRMIGEIPAADRNSRSFGCSQPGTYKVAAWFCVDSVILTVGKTESAFFVETMTVFDESLFRPHGLVTIRSSPLSSNIVNEVGSSGFGFLPVSTSSIDVSTR